MSGEVDNIAEFDITEGYQRRRRGWGLVFDRNILSMLSQ
jgi:hypothetical protein